MELKRLINEMGNYDCVLDPSNIPIENVLSESKYNKLLSYLLENNIRVTNDLKRLSIKEYNRIKMGIPDISQVGEEKTNLYIKKIDLIRGSDNSSYAKNTQLQLEINRLDVKPIGKIRSSNRWTIEINLIKYDNSHEFLDIRKVKNDGTRSKGISIRKELISDFKKIINQIPDSENSSEEVRNSFNQFENGQDNNLILDYLNNEFIDRK